MFSVTAGAFVSCKDYEGDAVWNEQIAQNANLISALEQQVAGMKLAQANCQAQCKKTQDSLAQITKVNAEAIAANGGKISTLEQNLAALKTTLDKNSADIAANKLAIENAKLAIEGNKTAIDLLKTDVAANGRSIAQNSLDIINLTSRVAALEEADRLINATIERNHAAVNTRIDSVVNAINDVNVTALKALGLANGNADAIAQLKGSVVGLQDDVKTLYEKAFADSTLAAKALTVADSAAALAGANLVKIQSLGDELDATKVTVGQLETAYKDADKVLKDQLDDLSSRVAALERALKLQVTSINVNGAYSSLLGYYALPSGDVRNTILAAYYGNAAEFRFPTSTLSFYADQENTLTAGDLEVTGNTNAPIEGGKLIVTEDGQEGNAGTLYMTLNPTSVDLTGKSFALVNSQGEESAVSLSNVVSSDKVLYFGYTRANANGFYEAKATVTADNALAVKPNVKLADLQAAAAELMKTWRNGPTDLLKIFSLVYNNTDEVLPALALKTSWEDNGVVNSTLSQYGVAATAVRPLSFGTLKDLNVKLPTITAVQQVGVDIDTVYVAPTTGLEPYTLYIVHDGGKVTTYTVDEMDRFVDQLNKRFTNIANNAVDKANSYINKYNNFANRLSGIINRFNERLQPVVFIQKDNEFFQLSQVPYGADALASGSIINITTYTAELLAPAYKKWVAVTNVWNNTTDAMKEKVSGATVASAQNGDAALKSALTNANNGTNMNKVVYGTVRNATLGTLESGKVYEISFSCVDYSGKVAARKFYVRGE